jgi:protein-S-isoprenylcysteine O-methyltransferase Ste14
MISPGNTASALWLVWLAVWYLAAIFTRRTVARESPVSQLSYGVFIWAGAAMLFFHLAPWQMLTRPLFSPTAWIPWAGVALVALGLVYSMWARKQLGALWSAAVTLKQEHAIVRTGPYAITRHPIYTGLLLALVGTMLVRNEVAALLGCALIAIGVVLKVRREEALLTQHFGDAYLEYRAAVPRLVPLPWTRGRKRPR